MTTGTSIANTGGLGIGAGHGGLGIGSGQYTVNSTSSSPFLIYTGSNPQNTISSQGKERIKFNADGTTEIKGDLVIQGRSISDQLQAIEERLSILVPDPEKLEKYESLKRAYQEYKMLEALLHE